MFSECLPFTNIPHTSRLFLDFLSYSGKAPQFYPRSPYIREWVAEEAKSIVYPADRRKVVADLLERQNRGWGMGEKTAENLRRFRDGANVVVTGQQVGVFGGPLFAILKALTAVALAEKSESAGVPAVPVFWLATEDHDLAEVSVGSVPASDGSLVTLRTSAKTIEESPVGDAVFTADIDAEIEKLTELLGTSDATDALSSAYRSGEKMGDAFAKFYSKVLAEWGVILIDAYEADFHQLAKPIYLAAANKADKLDELLLQRGKELEAAGYHQQVKVTSSSTQLFEILDGKRVVVQRSNGHFKAGSNRYTKEELLQRISATPEKFSANVLLRPVVQDYLLPTLAYTGGPAEVAYFTQVGVVHEQLLGRKTPVIPRFSATIVEPKQQKFLKKYNLKFADLLHGPEKLRVIMAQRVLPASLQQDMENAEQLVGHAMEKIRADLQQLDPTLVDSASKAEAKMRYQLQRLGGRAARAELKRNEVIDSNARNLSTHLFPNKNLPEREILGVYYLAKYGFDLLHTLHEAAQKECPDHQVLYL